MTSRTAQSVFALALVLSACNTGGARPEPTPSPAAEKAPEPAKPATSAEAPSGAALHLGAPIDASAQKVALSDVAKNPDAFTGKTFTTTGTVSAVCQHMGCWMEIKDDAGEAHIKMAGHSFFVPKTASGRKAKVLATLVKNENEPACEGAGHEGHGKGKGCKAEAEAQLGRPLAKLELVAQGVELL